MTLSFAAEILKHKGPPVMTEQERSVMHALVHRHEPHVPQIQDGARVQVGG